jgi:hypothetical protein
MGRGARTIEAIRAHHQPAIEVFRDSVPTVETGYFTAVRDIATLLEAIDGAIERAATDHYEGIGYRQSWAELSEARRDEYRQMWREILLGTE